MHYTYSPFLLFSLQAELTGRVLALQPHTTHSAAAGDDLLQHVTQIFCFFHGVLRAKGEPHGTVADLLRHADAQQDVAGVQTVGVAGRAGGGADAVHIQIQQDGLALQTREADVYIVGQTGAAAAVQAGFGDVLQHAVDDVVPQLGLVGHALVQMGGGDLQGLAHGGDAGHILGACAVAGLLAAAVDQVLGPDALAAVQGAHALGAVELVSAHGQHIHAQLLDVHRDGTHSLHGIGVHPDAMLVSDLSDFLNGLDGADLVVGHHDADEGGIGADGSLHVLRADIALRGGLDIGDFKAQALQRSHAVHDGVVLKRTGDEVLLVLACLGKGSALDRPVVSLRAAAGEEDLRRGSIDGLGHLRAAGVHKLLGLGMPHLLLPGNHVLPELRLRGEKLLNLLGRGKLRPPLPLPLLPGTKQFRLPPAVCLRIGIAGAENGGHVTVVFRETSVSPADGLLQRQPELVQQIAHAHDIVVVVMRGIHHALLVQFPADTCYHALHPPPARLIRLLHAGKVEAERFCLVMVMHQRIMRQSAQSRGILAGRVESTLRQLLVILVYPVERMGVQRQTVLVGHLPVQTVAAHHPHPLPADSGIGQHGMRVGTHFFKHLPRPSFGQMVKIHHREARPATDVSLPFSVLKTHRHSKAGAGRLFPVGSRLLPLRTVVTVFFGTIGQHLVLPDQTDYFIKRHRHGHRVGITLKNT